MVNDHDDEPSDQGRNNAVIAWLALHVVAFLLTPVREGPGLRFAAALAMPIIMFI